MKKNMVLIILRENKNLTHETKRQRKGIHKLQKETDIEKRNN